MAKVKSDFVAIAFKNGDGCEGFMSKITVDLANVAAIESFKEDIALGKVTLVRSKSATGKSSILRGTVLGLSGSVVNSKPAICEEAGNLEIHDTTHGIAILCVKGATHYFHFFQCFV